jgi:hypothetical protein
MAQKISAPSRNMKDARRPGRLCGAAPIEECVTGSFLYMQITAFKELPCATDKPIVSIASC